MIRPVLRMGNPRLLSQAMEVTEFDTPDLHALIADMFDTMAHEGGVGLAAPQIGIGLRVVIFGFESSERYPEAEAIPLTVLINPELQFIGDATEEGWEGCLSVPGLRGLVPRYQKLRYAGYDQFGMRIEREVEDFHARVVQHECDHLDGVLYPMRVRDFRQFGFSDEIVLTQEA
ncbi:MAG: peptide deformylase [Proteobacteria bacterium]|nr:peptide deformylase [Pseudomonadota bacterium]